MKAMISWQEGMAFKAHLGGFDFMIDSQPEFGGKNRGPSPKGLTLISLAGCTGMDVISILEKMRVKVTGFDVLTDAVLAQEHPKKFEEIVVKYSFKGENLPVKKIKDAINLSIDSYCGVLATLKPVVKITYKILINDQEVE